MTRTFSTSASAPAIPGLRPVCDDDAEALYALIGGCFDEYRDQGVVMDRDGIDSDLEAWASSLTATGGEGWVVDHVDGGLAASIGYGLDGDIGEIKRLYMRTDMRGQGLADRLLALVEDAVRTRSGRRMMLWSDTRFTRAHSFYRRWGYVQLPETRRLFDPSDTTEYQFAKEL